MHHKYYEREGFLKNILVPKNNWNFKLLFNFSRHKYALSIFQLFFFGNKGSTKIETNRLFIVSIYIICFGTEIFKLFIFRSRKNIEFLFWQDRIPPEVEQSLTRTGVVYLHLSSPVRCRQIARFFLEHLYHQHSVTPILGNTKLPGEITNL